MTTGPLLSASHLGYAFAGAVRAIGDLSFDLQRGEILSIVGPSGCGKSTLLRLISELSEPTNGSITRNFQGAERHGCSMVFQEDTLLPWLTVEENVGLYYRFNRKRRESGAKAHVLNLLKMVKLQDFAGFYPYQLSGGMRRRVAILAAIAPQPELLLLDEPFSALDEPTRIELHSDLHMLLKRMEIGAILVTHDLSEAAALSDRILILSKAPAKIVKQVEVPFGPERNMYDLRERDDFLKMYSQLWHSLKEQISWQN